MLFGNDPDDFQCRSNIKSTKTAQKLSARNQQTGRPSVSIKQGVCLLAIQGVIWRYPPNSRGIYCIMKSILFDQQHLLDLAEVSSVGACGLEAIEIQPACHWRVNAVGAVPRCYKEPRVLLTLEQRDHLLTEDGKDFQADPALYRQTKRNLRRWVEGIWIVLVQHKRRWQGGRWFFRDRDDTGVRSHCNGKKARHSGRSYQGPRCSQGVYPDQGVRCRTTAFETKNGAGWTGRY